MTAPAEPRDLVLSSLSWPEIRDIRDQVEHVRRGVADTALR